MSWGTDGLHSARPVGLTRPPFLNLGHLMMNHSPRRVAGLLAACASTALLGACADEAQAPLAPSARPALSASRAPQSSTSDKELAALRLTRAEFDKLKSSWSKFEKSVEDGDSKAEALRCDPGNRLTATKRIGAKGGQITLGGNSIEIPAGALASDVDISITSRPGPFVELEFAPHGLKFAKPVEITFNYARCDVPAGTAIDVVFVGNGWRILENMPSSDRRTTKKMSALTDHFSGYMMSTARKGAAQAESEDDDRNERDDF